MQTEIHVFSMGGEKVPLFWVPVETLSLSWKLPFSLGLWGLLFLVLPLG